MRGFIAYLATPHTEGLNSLFQQGLDVGLPVVPKVIGWLIGPGAASVSLMALWLAASWVGIALLRRKEWARQAAIIIAKGLLLAIPADLILHAIDGTMTGDLLLMRGTNLVGGITWWRVFAGRHVRAWFLNGRNAS